MSLTDTTTTTASAAASLSDSHHHQRGLDLLPSKRKLDEYDSSLDEDDDDVSDLVSVRMRKAESTAAPSTSSSASSSMGVFDARSSPASCAAQAGLTLSPTRLQFFVRLISESKSLVIHGNPEDSVKSVHERIRMITGIPVMEQRLIYQGKQLQWEQSLAECAVENDAGMHLVGRMRSTDHPLAWQVIGDMISAILRLCRGETVPSSFKIMRTRLNAFLTMTPKDDGEAAIGHIQIFITSSAPAALVMLYMSPLKGNRECADNSIRHFLNSSQNSLSKHLHSHCATIVLELCKLLRRAPYEDPLYLSCRSTLGSLLGSIGISHGLMNIENVKVTSAIPELFPFVSELASRLSKDLASIDTSTSVGPLSGDVQDFIAFLHPLRTAIMEQMCFVCPISLPLHGRDPTKLPLYGEQIESLHVIFMDLLKNMDKCLHKVGECLAMKGNGEGEIARSGWSQYLAILKELNGISKLYHGAEEQFWRVMRFKKVAICALIIRYAKRTDDHQWLLEHKKVTDFECRRHLAMMMFPEAKEDYEELHEMLIDRSQLLAESFEYVLRTEPEYLHAGLFMEFKNEEATGPGVLREWFFLVCQAIFNPQNALFVACPNDRRRFYPNPASKVDPLHLEYFKFSGRVIALALMHRVQVGIVFDRVFFMQLAGKGISLEDIQDADPFLYSSCKQILEMDDEFIDSDALGLTFVREVEELGSRKIVELCPDGKSIVVSSKNRKEYVQLLIQHRFVISISEQVSHFAQGFADILYKPRLQKFFFQSLEHEDLDWMLHGSESAINVEDWKAHTDYNGYKETDPQILWLWKIVGEMPAEQKKVLLFFWTSVKYLPVEGFGGLASRLYIYKCKEPEDHLPSSHTCFYRICFPPYPSMAVMQDRLNIITQEHVGCSFGTW